MPWLVGGLNKEVLLLAKSAVNANVFLKLSNLFIWNYILDTKLKDTDTMNEYANINYHLFFQLDDPVYCEWQSPIFQLKEFIEDFW